MLARRTAKTALAAHARCAPARRPAGRAAARARRCGGGSQRLCYQRSRFLALTPPPSRRLSPPSVQAGVAQALDTFVGHKDGKVRARAARRGGGGRARGGVAAPPAQPASPRPDAAPDAAPGPVEPQRAQRAVRRARGVIPEGEGVAPQLCTARSPPSLTPYPSRRRSCVARARRSSLPTARPSAAAPGRASGR